MKTFIKSALFIVMTVIGCSSDQSLRFSNGSLIITKTYELALSDTNKIFTIADNNLILNSFHDSLITRTDTIWYKDAVFSNYDKIFGKIDQAVINSNNPNITELYRTENNNIHLLGYSTKDRTNPFIKFESPLIIYPSSSNLEQETTDSKMIKLNSARTELGQAVKVQTKLKRKLISTLKLNDNIEECYLYELTMKQDGNLQFGEQGLIIPNAVVISSNLLIGSQNKLIAEWGIRSRQKKDQSINKDKDELQNYETYIEFNYYKKDTKE